MSGNRHHPNHPSVDQSGRRVRKDLRQTGDTDVDPVDGGSEVEHELSVNQVSLRDVAVERRIRIEGPDAEAFVNQDSRQRRHGGVSAALPKM